ncbi:hypothetical protein J4Q44_G00389950, partial [Coregonus suidteri]
IIIVLCCLFNRWGDDSIEYYSVVSLTGGEVRVRLLDWLRHDLCTDADTEFGWTEDEVADLHDNTTVIIAADVCYDDDLTDALFRTLYRICNQPPSPLYYIPVYREEAELHSETPGRILRGLRPFPPLSV